MSVLAPPVPEPLTAPATNPVRECLESGRGYVAQRHIRGHYCDPLGGVCAIGGIQRALGHEHHWSTRMSPVGSVALKLLDQAALDLYPCPRTHTARDQQTRPRLNLYPCPHAHTARDQQNDKRTPAPVGHIIETLSEWTGGGKQPVLNCYDLAIARAA